MPFDASQPGDADHDGAIVLKMPAAPTAETAELRELQAAMFPPPVQPRELPPRGAANLPLERAVIGAMFVDPDAAALALSIVKPEDFYDSHHVAIVSAVSELLSEGKPIDTLSVADRMFARMGQKKLERHEIMLQLLEFSDAVGSTLAVEGQAQAIMRYADVRRMVNAAAIVQRMGMEAGVSPDEFLAESAAALQAAMNTRDNGRMLPIGSLVTDVFKQIMLAKSQGSEIIGVPTGFPDLDRLLLGLHKTDLIIVAARPAMGKTAIALNLVANVATRRRGGEPGHGTLVFSMEMGREQLVQRILAARAQVPLTSLRTGRLSVGEEVDLRDTAADVSEMPIFIDDTPALSINELTARAKSLAVREKIDLIIVDYLQLMKGNPRGSREQEVSECARGLKALAKSLNCTVIALAQLNRDCEKRADKRPMMADLRESGEIEQAADIIAFLYRDIVYNKEAPDNAAEFIVAKHRAGPCATVKLLYDARITRFGTWTEPGTYPGAAKTGNDWQPDN